MTGIDRAMLLEQARLDRQAIPQFDPGIDIDEAYRVQARLVEQRLAGGDRVIGMKMGFTSRAKMVQMGVSDMIWGRLTRDMQVDDGDRVDVSRFIHPRAEPEIAFLLRRPLAGRVTALEALDAVAAVAPAIEIIDSRFRSFRFSLTDVVADNCSSAAFVIGPWAPPSIDLSNLGMIFSVDGRPSHCASSAALLGHPARSLVAAARLVESHGALGGELAAGSVVLAGAATAAVALVPGQDISLEVERLGMVSFSVGGGA
jgi:2-oxo-3-hexenedioate decarboxylase